MKGCWNIIVRELPSVSGLEVLGSNPIEREKENNVKSKILL